MKLVKQAYSTYTDEQLMDEVVKGNSRAFTEVYERYSKPMLNYFYKMLWQDKLKAEDFMQELFTKIVHKPHLFNSKLKFKTWIFSIANNMCKNEYRKQEVRKDSNNDLHDNIAINDDSDNQIKKVDESLFSDRLKEELKDLSNAHREVFILRFKQGLSLKEIAEVLDVSEGTVKSRVFYTLKKLSANLKEFNPVAVSLLLLLGIIYNYGF